MALWVWPAVGVLGGIFSILRFLVDASVSERASSEFPWGTFVVNVSGAFVLGALFGAALSGTTYLLAGTACIGSYTTFSTWMLESHRLGDDDDRRPLVMYIVASLVAGLIAATLGREVGMAL